MFVDIAIQNVGNEWFSPLEDLLCQFLCCYLHSQSPFQFCYSASPPQFRKREIRYLSISAFFLTPLSIASRTLHHFQSSIPDSVFRSVVCGGPHSTCSTNLALVNLSGDASSPNTPKSPISVTIFSQPHATPSQPPTGSWKPRLRATESGKRCATSPPEFDIESGLNLID